MLKALILTVGILFPEYNINLADVKKLSFNTPQGLTYDIYTNNFLSKISPNKIIMLLHGVTEQGKNDIRLIGLAKTFAKSGYSVFVPDIEGLKNSQIGFEEVDRVKMYLSEMLNKFKNSKTKGVLTFCYSNSPLIAALSTDENLIKEINFMIFWSGCYELKEMFRYTLLGYYRLDNNETIFIREPDAEFKQKISNQKIFSITKKSVHQFLKNQNKELFDTCYNKLPKNIIEYMEFMSPKNHMQKFMNSKCKITFIHTMDDTVIPYQETVKLYNLCPAKNKKLLLLSIYTHVDKKINLRSMKDVLKDMKNLYLVARGL
ncbi:MAG: hypothetical protein ABID79_04745 [Elusimicrobiota bacterium]